MCDWTYTPKIAQRPALLVDRRNYTIKWDVNGRTVCDDHTSDSGAIHDQTTKAVAAQVGYFHASQTTREHWKMTCQMSERVKSANHFDGWTAISAEPIVRSRAA